MLQAACYVVIAFLSGMRDGEVKHLRRGCLRVQRDADGRPYRWVVTSLAFKGERDPTGVQATWTVGRPVADAIEVLQRLHPPGVDEFGPLRRASGWSCRWQAKLRGPRMPVASIAARTASSVRPGSTTATAATTMSRRCSAK